MKREQFMREIERIFQVALTQKITKMVLRAAWVGGAIYLFCWGVNRLWGWLPNQAVWFWLAGVSAALILGSAFLQRAPSKGFVWRLDRGYRLQEQAYTAYEIIEQEKSEGKPHPETQELLQSDQLARLPFIRRELVDKGWRIKGEFEATIIVLILLAIVYLLSIEDIGRFPQEQSFGLIPSLGRDPSAAEVLSDNIPGELEDRAGGNVIPEELADSANAICQGNWNDVVDTFVDLGEVLGQQPSTFDVGQSLQEQDFTQAADAFGNLAEDVNDLSPESREGLAQAFLDTAIRLQSINRPELSTYFQNVSAALFAGDRAVMAEGLDGLVSLMEQCRYCPKPSNMEIANTSQQSLTIEVGAGEVPSPVDIYANPIVVEGGSIGVVESLNVNPGAEVPAYAQPLPYNFNLEDSDVVSSYFSPR